MNKKILSIIFTLFLAGLLSISCSNKDTTGPDDNGGGSTTPTIPTIPENGEGIDKSFRDRSYAPKVNDDTKVTFTDDKGSTTEFTDENTFQQDVDSDGSILIKMPKLKEIGFTGDMIRIPVKNIVLLEGQGLNYSIHTAYIFENGNTTVRFDLKSEMYNIFASTTKMTFKLTKTTTVTEENKDPQTTTQTYSFATSGIRHYRLAFGDDKVTALDGTGAIEPNYKK